MAKNTNKSKLVAPATNENDSTENALNDLAPLPQDAKRNPVAPAITPEDFKQNNAQSEQEQFRQALKEFLTSWNRDLTAMIPINEIPSIMEKGLNCGRNETHLQNPAWVIFPKTK